MWRRVFSLASSECHNELSKVYKNFEFLSLKTFASSSHYKQKAKVKDDLKNQSKKASIIIIIGVFGTLMAPSKWQSGIIHLLCFQSHAPRDAKIMGGRKRESRKNLNKNDVFFVVQSSFCGWFFENELLRA